jgi:hypothetical protein
MFSGPEGLDVSKDGTVFIITWPTCDLIELTTQGAKMRSLFDVCRSGLISAPTDVAVNSRGVIYLNSGCGVLVLDGAAPPGLLPGSGGCGPGSESNAFLGITIDGNDNVYFVSRNPDCTVKKYDGSTTQVIAGKCGIGGVTALATEAAVRPSGIAVGADGVLYISDDASCTVRKVVDEVMSLVAGNGECALHPSDGEATEISLAYPSGIAVDSSGAVYITEGAVIRVIRDGRITTIAGTDAGYSGDGGPATEAELWSGFDLALDEEGSIYFVEFLNCVVRRIKNDVIETVAGQPCDQTTATIDLPTSVATPEPSGPCSEARATLLTELTPERVYHDGDALRAEVEYSAPGCTTARAYFRGHHIAGSPRYHYYCPQCVRPNYPGGLSSDEVGLPSESGVIRLEARPGPFPPPEAASEPNLEGFQLCTLTIDFGDGQPEGNSVDQAFDVPCGEASNE